MPSKTELPTVPALLQVAVHSLGGKERSNQLTMASAVAHSIDTGEHLAVQAGTGTGKSLAYLVPSIRHAVESGKTVIVSTATIALQRQLVDRDLPRLSDALTEAVGRRPKFAILKGRNNYLCMNKIHTGAAQETPDAELFDPFAVSRMGREVVRLTKWSSETETGDRDDVVPGVSDQAWRQVSVTARECLGKSRCPVGEDCFAERARTEAAQVDVVVTNHALLAIDAITGIQILPEHDVVVVDEAHELVDRVTGVATEELSAATVTAAARRSAKLIEEETVDQLEGAAENWAAILDELPPGRWQSLPDGVGPALASVRDAAWAVRTAIGPNKQGMASSDPEAAAARSAALVAVDEVHDSAVRVLTAFDEPDPAKRKDVVWHAVDDFRGNVKRTVRIAPLSVGGLLRARLFAESTVVLTSATLTVGGSFDGLAVNWGLPAEKPSRSDTAMASGVEPPSDNGSIRWNSLDVGSPFDHARAGIMYIAKHLSPPGRDGLSKSSLDEIESLVEAAGGRTLGLFSSMRAAKAAAEEMRERLDTPILCQGDDSTGALVQKFADDEATSLFGTLSLWQGVDVPGPSLSLVILDRIPFPRPDDPLLVARQQAVESRGGNGFLAVAANHAALLLAQGVGRLLRSVDDKGVVAVLDSRLATARYGGYLRASLPPFWETSNPEVVRKALTRLAGK
ncbi:ATP-dependent helicase [Rhodococcus sp. 05-2256-B2]|uniref:ATP-dependent DNA helicase n=1 Tax=unclassified Rhodococcus (in: high G+C Gram-positive bacteria) TaxID=192944 RepID=UPI000B9ACDE7|nr:MULTISPECIES: ATP-dependent DNA helicase [unclassified Rhodococcus (in: high G+C Gram-positive bacteria)]OZD77274.1 ATP-dependent helicase [Rhodococcus sp. 05-2256-B4]OZD88393.1 ATP-dependent helicase [Rhodococcus sp. 05-2256-B3]OZD98526.1 ATP-dependent helicase [Rhodococcus sp. 05-2256-B2]OZE05267.1 ATP-dependent helicase [Rhodococcus sp. 05-2256-B1]